MMVLQKCHRSNQASSIERDRKKHLKFHVYLKLNLKQKLTNSIIITSANAMTFVCIYICTITKNIFT